MPIPFQLYVDEIGPDKVKATVSKGSNAVYNLRLIMVTTDPFFAHVSATRPLPGEVNGIAIMPAGKFICMYVKKEHNMILLDLVDRPDLAAMMAERLGDVNLKERFMQVYKEIMANPKTHNWFELVVGDPDPRPLDAYNRPSN